MGTSPTTMLLISILFIAILHNASGYDCEWGGSKSILDKLNVFNPKSCPTIKDERDEEFCCVDGSTGLNVCCDINTYLKPKLTAFIAFAILAAGALLICCVCCCCCPCCALYKRLHGGAVYGRVVQPGTQTVITVHQPAQQAPVYPVQPMGQFVPQPMVVNYPPAEGYPVYPSAGQQPPPYSEATTSELYTKQAPYNPHYQ